ncbi:MAG: protein kinase [Verrucomicrobia bacterium]|nr:protein kinase [Verrucomicrobiota bacterium]
MSKPSEKLEAVFEAALALETEAQRADYLNRVCPEPELRREVESLLAAHEHPDSVFEEETVRAETLPSEGVGAVIGRYKLLEKLGEGGFGSVWLAEQKEPVRRKVALKVIKLGMDTRQVVARFEAERQALALMDHPNIAKVLDAGTTGTTGSEAIESQISNLKSQIPQGRPYFVMELVRGIPITRFCDENKLTPRERLDLFIKVCHAVQHAHQKGIIHRDLKPSNVLVTLHDGVPVPKVIDFGIAKATQQELTDKTIHTLFQQFIGTPAYVSPEQAEMSGLDIDTRSAIYSLGVLLYELLTGATPFDGRELLASGLDEMRRTIREKEPVRPSTKLSQTLVAANVSSLKSPDGRPGTEEESRADSRRLLRIKETIALLRGDLDWIVMKCLEKDRARRYETANGLAMDIKRHLNNETVVARPPSAGYRFQKLFRRNKLAFAAAGAVTAALVVGLSVAVIGLARERTAKQRALEAQAEQRRLKEEAVAARDNEAAQRERADLRGREARLNLYAADMMTAQQHLAHGNLGAARRLLDGHGPQAGEDHRGWEWRYFREQAEGARPVRLEGHTDTVKKIRFSPDGRILASGGGDFRLWDLDKQNQPRPWNRPETVLDFAFTRDGRLGVITRSGELLLLDPVTLRASKSFAVAGAKSMVFSPAANAAAVEIADAAPIWLDLDTGTSKPIFGGAAVWPCDISDDGTMVCGQAAGDVFVWSIPDNVPLAREAKLPRSGWLHDMKFLPGRRGVLVASFEREPVVLAPRDSQWRWESAFEPFQRGTSGLAMSQAGGFVAASSFNHEVNLWNVADFRFQVRFYGHLDEAWSVAVSPDGRTVASGGQDRLVLLWDSHWRPPEQRIEGEFNVSDPVFKRDGRWLALRGQNDRVEVWDLRDNRLVKSLPDAGVPLGFTESDAGLLTLTRTNLLVWDTRTWQPAKPVGLGFVVAMSPGWPGGSAPLASLGGHLLALADANDIVHVLNVNSRNEAGSIPARILSLALSADGRWLAVADASDEGMGIFHLWELLAGKPVKKSSHQAHARETANLSFSPDSRRLASFGVDSLAKVWSVEPFVLLHELRGHKRGLFGGGFSPDGRTLASVDHLHALNLWHVETGRQLASFEPKSPAETGHDLAQAAFSPDGRYLVAWRKNGHCQFWQAPSFDELEIAEPASTRFTAP